MPAEPRDEVSPQDEGPEIFGERVPDFLEVRDGLLQAIWNEDDEIPDPMDDHDLIDFDDIDDSDEPDEEN